MDSKRFIECVTDTLMEENVRRVDNGKHLLDVAYMLAPISQHIGAAQYTAMLNSLDEKCYIQYIRDSANDYSDGELRITPSGGERYYTLTFTYADRMWGYCDCQSDNAEYNTKHNCCGNGCDWTAPAFTIEKVEYLGRTEWTGVARDYWHYEESMNTHLAERNADVERERKDRKTERLNNEIAKLTQELNELH